jgi:hypothetical protein
MFFPIDRAVEVLRAWWQWLPSVPDTVTSVGRVLRMPPLPDVPEQLRGRSFAVVEAVCQLADEQANALLAPLRALGPAMDTFQRTRVAALSKLHMDPERPVPGHGHGMLLGDFDAAAIDEFGRVGLATTSLLSLELRHLGGALTPGHMTGGAVDGLDASFALFAVGITPDAAAAHAVQDDLAAVAHAMAPWSTGGCYLNFAEDRQPGATFFGAPAYRRLEQVKAIYDPADLIRANHPIHPRRS